ncbi:MAG: flagellin N-terminal helical domain-containing protein [Planctomycetota bacterium]
MGLTVNNTNTLTLLNILNRNTRAQSSTMQQLTTGKRINTGADDPAGLIALAGLNSELSAVDTALTNNTRTASILTVMDSSIIEISALLSEIENLVNSSASNANLTAAETAANQSQIDDALAAIDRIVQTTQFNGQKLLDGSFSIQSEGFANNQYLENLRIFSRSQVTTDTSLTINRVASAQTASATLAFMTTGNSATSGSTSLAITGSLGTVTLSVASGTSQAGLVTLINNTKDQTGVSAIQQASSIKLNSTLYGSDEYVSAEVLSGGVINNLYGTATSDGATSNDMASFVKTKGTDANITVNGQVAGTDGLDVSYNANGLSLSFTLSDDFGSGNTGATTSTSFTVKADGGATFQLGTTADTRQTIGVDSLATYKLGGSNGTVKLTELKSGGSSDLKTDVEGALKSIRGAIREVASIRGRLGGFQKFAVGSSIRSLEANQKGLTEAASVIGDTDFALATAELNKQQVLIQSGISLLSVANQQAAYILALL